MAVTAKEQFASTGLEYSLSLVYGLQDTSKTRTNLRRYNRLQFIEAVKNDCTSLDETTLNLYIERNGL